MKNSVDVLEIDYTSDLGSKPIAEFIQNSDEIELEIFPFKLQQMHEGKIFKYQYYAFDILCSSELIIDPKESLEDVWNNVMRGISKGEQLYHAPIMLFYDNNDICVQRIIVQENTKFYAGVKKIIDDNLKIMVEFEDHDRLEELLYDKDPAFQVN